MNPMHLTMFKKKSLMVQEIKKAIDWHGRAVGPFLLHCANVQRRHCQYAKSERVCIHGNFMSSFQSWCHKGQSIF